MKVKKSREYVQDDGSKVSYTFDRADGKIIGINSFKFPDSPGLNYAVSSDEVISFLKNYLRN